MYRSFKTYKDIDTLLKIAFPTASQVVDAIKSGNLQKDNFFKSSSKILCTALEIQKIVARAKSQTLPRICVHFRLDFSVFPIQNIVDPIIIQNLGDLVLHGIWQDRYRKFITFDRLPSDLPIWGMIEFSDEVQKIDITKFIRLYLASEFLEYFIDIYAEYYKYQDFISTVVFADKKIDVFGKEDYSLVIERLEKRLNRAKLHLILFSLEQKSASALANTRQNKGMSFEIELIERFREAGITATPTKRQGDFGADIIIDHLGVGVCIQCKDLGAPVGVKAIQEVVSSIRFYGCDFGMVISNSGYTDAAIELAAKNKIRLSNPSGCIESVTNLVRGF